LQKLCKGEGKGASGSWTARYRPAVRLAEVELSRRREVWHAAADLFLDSETRTELPRIALTLLGSGYAEAELERIFQFELVPECVWNLYDVAGAWAMMSLDEVRLARRAVRAPRTLARTFTRLLTPDSLRAQWRAVLGLRAHLGRAPQAERAGMAAVWTALAHAYLEERLEDVVPLEAHLEAIRGTGFSLPRCERAFTAELLPLYRDLLTRRERDTEALRTQCVVALIARAFTKPPRAGR
jgi:hypothetical protein